ncbi:MAG: hypothetical protein ACKV1O_21135 [Saprospiraceae bacterium]
MIQNIKIWWDNLSVNWKRELQHIYPINLEIFVHNNIYEPSFKNSYNEFYIHENNPDFYKYNHLLSSVNTLTIGWRDIDYPEISVQVEDFEPLIRFVNLEALWFFSDLVLSYHFDSLENLKHIKAMELQTQNMENINFCTNYFNLEYLVIRNAFGLSSLSPLRHLNKLKYLNVSKSNIYSIECLIDKSISYLNISNTLVPLREINTFKKFNPNAIIQI